ncbi:MAG: response regulator, partial [Parafilimonas terrae]|nr:response regulator [Parafilimonas terrae]
MPPDLVHVLDDDPAMRDSLAFLLGTEGFAVQLYETGADLLDRLGKPAAGCVLTDIRMPGIDGIELLRRLRSAGHRLPVIMMTGHGDVPLAVAAMKLGACDFIEKPF